MLLQLPDAVLQVLLVPSADELQIRHRALAGRQNDQPPHLLSIIVVVGGVPFQIQRGQRQERLLCNRAQPVFHLGIQPLLSENLAMNEGSRAPRTEGSEGL